MRGASLHGIPIIFGALAGDAMVVLVGPFAT